MKELQGGPVSGLPPKDSSNYLYRIAGAFDPRFLEFG